MCIYCFAHTISPGFLKPSYFKFFREKCIHIYTYIHITIYIYIYISSDIATLDFCIFT